MIQTSMKENNESQSNNSRTLKALLVTLRLPLQASITGINIASLNVCGTVEICVKMNKNITYRQSSLASLQHGDYHFNADSPNSFPCTILLNTNIAGSLGKRTRHGIQGRSDAPVQIFKLCTCPLDLLNQHSAIQHRKMELEIGVGPLVSVPHTHLS